MGRATAETKQTKQTKQAEPILAVASAAAWRAWLASHHARSPGVLLRITKKTAGATGAIGYAEALEGALAWGWIDSQKKGLDAAAWLQRFTPRQARSPLSVAWTAGSSVRVCASPMRCTTSSVSIDEEIMRACDLPAPKFDFDSSSVRQTASVALDKLMATFHKMNDASGKEVIRCFVKGAPDQLLTRAATVFDADAEVHRLAGSRRAAAQRSTRRGRSAQQIPEAPVQLFRGAPGTGALIVHHR